MSDEIERKFVFCDPSASMGTISFRETSLLGDPLSKKIFDGSFDGFQITDEKQRPVVEIVRRAAGQLVERKDKIVKEDPDAFAEGKILSIYGQSGCGKSHLLNALLNHLKEHAPDLLNTVTYLAGAKFGEEFVDRSNGTSKEHTDPFADSKVLVVDDPFADYPNVVAVHQLPKLAVDRFRRLIRGVYLHKQLVIMTAHFRVLEGLQTHLAKADLVGRDTSRLAAVRGASKELLLPGKNYAASVQQGVSA